MLVHKEIKKGNGQHQMTQMRQLMFSKSWEKKGKLTDLICFM
jgi:hypothetical protein